MAFLSGRSTVECISCVFRVYFVYFVCISCVFRVFRMYFVCILGVFLMSRGVGGRMVGG